MRLSSGCGWESTPYSDSQVTVSAAPGAEAVTEGAMMLRAIIDGLTRAFCSPLCQYAILAEGDLCRRACKLSWATAHRKHVNNKRQVVKDSLPESKPEKSLKYEQ